MKKLSSNSLIFPFLSILPILIFFIFNVILGKVPIPADVVLGLYHPWRDESFDGYNPTRFPTKNPLITDPVLQTYPWRKLTIENIKSVRIPFWNPYSFSGQPLLANIQSAPFSVFNLLFIIFPFNLAWILQITLPSILLSLFTYLFLRSLNLSQVSSIFAGAILPFCGFFVAWITWGTVVTTVLWLPLILLSIKKLNDNYKLYSERENPSIHARVESESAKRGRENHGLQTVGIYFWCLILTFSCGQVIFAGHWQTALYVFLAAFLYSIFNYKNQRSLKILFVSLAAIAIGILISSIQVLPSLEFINLSARELDQGYYQGRQDWFLPLQHLIGFFAPDYFGSPVTYNYWGVWNWAEFASFAGLFPLILAMIAAFKAKGEANFFKMLLAVSFILAIENPISKIPYLANWPFLSSNQPSRIISLMIFSLVALSAFGLEKFIEDFGKKKKLYPYFFIFFVFFVLCAIALYTIIWDHNFPVKNGIDSQKVALRNLVFPTVTALMILGVSTLRFLKLNFKLILACLILLTFFELFRFSQKFTPFARLSWVFPQTHVTNFLKNQPRPFRIMALDRRIFNGNSPAVYNIETVAGYDPLYLKDFAQFVTAWESGQVTNAGSFNRIITPLNYQSRIADFLNVKYLITFDEIEDQSFEKVFEYGQTKVYENKEALARAYFAGEIVKVEGRQKELEKLIDKNFDFSRQAVSSEFEYAPAPVSAKVEIIKYSDQSLTLKTNNSMQKEAPLVISNVYYPGWRAEIDGQEAHIKRVNYMFQAILVPYGEHEIEFKFKPKSFYNGLYLSASGLIAAFFGAFLLWRKRFL